MIDDYSRDYDVNKVKQLDPDYRFVAAAKEGVLTEVVYFIIVALAMAVGYSLSPSNPEEVTYMFGLFPTWLVAGVAVYVIGTIILLVYFMKTKIFSFEPRIDK